MNQDNVITTERVRILYERAFASISTAIAGAFIFAYIFREQIASPVLLVWLGYMSIVALVRYWLLFNYNKNKQNTSCHDKFEKRFTYAAGLVGIGWAFIIVSGLNLSTFEYRIYSLLLLTAIVALSVPIFSSSIKTIYFYIAPSLIITIPLLLSRGGDDTALGLALIIFTVMVIRSSKDIYNTLNIALNLRFQTQEQTESLKQLRHEKSETEQRMQSVMDNSPAVIYVKDIDGRFIFVNQEFLKLFHSQREDIMGKTLHDIFPKDIADEMRRNDLEVQGAKKSLKYEEVAPHDDGPHNYISIKFPLFDEAGILYAVGGVSTDITERFRIEESLRISQQRLLLHREQSPVGVIEWNTDFEVLDWNPAAQRIFGYTKEEVLGRHITEAILPESARQAVDKVWSDLLANKGGTHSINGNTTKDGRTILCEWHNTPLVAHDGNVIGVTSLVDDVTERQKNEESLRHSQKMNALGKLTGGIAHDFNNMLGVILGYSELLRADLSNDPNLEKYVDEIYRAGERARKLTSKLLAFSRKATTFSDVTDINTVIQDEQHLLEKTLTARINVVFKPAENLWPVCLDKASLEDAILNMSINALHAMPDGGTFTLGTRNVHLGIAETQKMDIEPGDYVLLSLTDTGIGMDETTQQQIFDPFFSTKGDIGTGLGMSQVYGFVKQSRGTISLYSEPGQGTQITIYFPRCVESSAVNSVQDAAGSVELPAGNETILVVDDEVALRKLTEEILTTHGYRVLCAEGGEQALDILETETVDLLLTDVIMPGMDGYQLVTKVKKRYPQIIFQVVSGFSDDYRVDLANEELHQQRLQKPLSSDVLLQRIRNLLDERAK